MRCMPSNINPGMFSLPLFIKSFAELFLDLMMLTSHGSMMVNVHGLFVRLVWGPTSVPRSMLDLYQWSLWYEFFVSNFLVLEILNFVNSQYLIVNLGFSHNFGDINFDLLTFPTTMSVDYIRVYQPKDAVNVGCDPAAFPTTKYIETCVPYPRV